MSITYVQPTMLGIVDKRATFWSPVVNENFLTCVSSLSPAVAALPTSARVKAGMPLWLSGNGLDGFRLSVTPTPIFAGVAAGPSTNRSVALVKMYGEATLLLPDADFPVGAVVGHNGTEFTTENVKSNGIGTITQKLEHPRENEFKYRVLLREGLPAGLHGYKDLKYALQPGALLSGVPASVNGMVCAGGFATLSPNSVQLNNAGCRGIDSAMHTASGARFTLRYSFMRAVASAHLVGAAGAQYAPLACSVSGNTVTVLGSDWVGGNPPVSCDIVINVQGIIGGRNL